MDTYSNNGDFVFPCRVCKLPIEVGPTHRCYQYYTASCPNCGLTMDHKLPQIQKKIIYLDQNVLSEIAKEKQPRWKVLRDRLSLLSYLQLIVCPFSDIHYSETLVLEGQLSVEVKALYHQLSAGCKFASPYQIELIQLRGSIRKFLGLSVPKVDLAGQIFNQDPNRWMLDGTVYVDMPLDIQVTKKMSANKAALQSGLDSAADNWRAENNQTFKDDVEREAKRFGVGRIELYRQLEGEIRSPPSIPVEFEDLFNAFTGGGRFNRSVPLGMQPGVQMVHWLACEVLEAQPDLPDPVAVVEEFFNSKDALSTPFNHISSHLWAGIAQAARSKNQRHPEANDANDISVIAHFAPYCDVMVIDRFFCSLATQKNMGFRDDFGVKFFSAKKMDELIAYLDGLISEMPVEHRKAIKAVIPRLPPLDFHWLP